MPRAPSAVRTTQHLFDDDAAKEDVRKIVQRNNGTSSRRNGRRQIAFGWYGGKYSHLEWLLPLLPDVHPLLRTIRRLSSRPSKSPGIASRNLQ